MSKYVEYEVNDGEFVKIPKEDIERLMKLPDVKTEDDACWIWCEDNEIVLNDEQEELTAKAKENNITLTIHGAREDKKTERKPRERKPDETKESIIASLAESLAEMVDNVQVVNVGKLIEFDFKGDHYKLDLIRQRKPKK